MAVVRIPTPLRQYAKGAKAVPVAGKTLAEALEHLEHHAPGLRARLLDGNGQVHAFVNVFVDGEDVRLAQGLATPLREDSEIDVIPAMAGGCLWWTDFELSDSARAGGDAGTRSGPSST